MRSRRIDIEHLGWEETAYLDLSLQKTICGKRIWKPLSTGYGFLAVVAVRRIGRVFHRSMSRPTCKNCIRIFKARLSHVS